MNQDKFHDETLDELEKTTDKLRMFEPRISKEAKTEDLENLFRDSFSIQKKASNEFVASTGNQEEVSTIKNETVDKQEKVEELVETIFDNKIEDTMSIDFQNFNTEVPYEETNYSIEMKQKRYGKVLMIVALLLIPALLSALIVANHSDLLINNTLKIVVSIFLGLSLVLFFVGVGIYFKRRREQTIRPKKMWQKTLYSIFMGCYAGGCVAVLLLLYGPNKAFKDWLVTTAMATMSHQHYATWFYNDSDIADVFSRNYIKETGDSTDASLIDTEIEDPNPSPEVPVVYENEYEQAILERDPGTLYKMITFDVNGCKAYLAVIYDPSKVGVTTTDRVGVRGQYVTTMAKREKALVAINGAGFYDPGHNSSGGKPRGITIVDGKIVTNNEYKAVTTGGLIGFTKENKLVLLKNTTAQKALEMGVRDAVSWGPFLIVNGKSAYTKGNGGWGYAARTAIGQRADGIVLFLVVDSNANRTKGANMVDLTRIMENYGAINAANLDGGTSSVMVENGGLISDPIDSDLVHQTRPIATSFIVTK